MGVPGGHMASLQLRVKRAEEEARPAALRSASLPPSLPPLAARSAGVEMEAQDHAGQVLVTFEDVALYFSLEEWAMLTAWQKCLYQEVMEDNFGLVASLGSQRPLKPELICKMEQGEELYAVGLLGQSGRDVCGTPVSATGSPSVQDLAPKEEFSGSCSPLAPPKSAVLEADSDFLKSCPSWSESKPPDVESASPGPWEWKEGRGSLGTGSPLQAELQICECGRSFENPASMHEHLCLHKEQKGPFACPSCGKLFRYHLNLLTHKKHRGKKRHACAQCGVQFCLKGDLLRHRVSHTGEGLHPCRICGLLFRHRRHLVAHEAEHRRDMAHPCPTCGVAFGNEAELVGHQLGHQEERPFLCTQCGESFSWKESLLLHQRTHAQHTGYSCHICGKTFSRHGNLLTHQRLHTGELPFHCPECDRSFPSKTSLVAHSKLHRRSSRPFACPHCRSSFGSEERLLEHQATHDMKERPIKQEAEP